MGCTCDAAEKKPASPNARLTASEARRPRRTAQVAIADPGGVVAVSVIDSAAWHGSIVRHSTVRGAFFVDMCPV